MIIFSLMDLKRFIDARENRPYPICTGLRRIWRLSHKSMTQPTVVGIRKIDSMIAVMAQFQIISKLVSSPRFEWS